MKNIVSIFALSLIIVSCSKSTTENTTVADSDSLKNDTIKNQLVVDSVALVDSMEISPLLTAKFDQNVLQLQGLKKIALDSIYKGELYDKGVPPYNYTKESITEILQNRKKTYFDNTAKDNKEFQPQVKQTWDRISKMKVYSNQNDYLTIQYTGYSYTGGAHGSSYELYRVIDLKTQKKIQLSDIVDVDKVDWNAVLLKNLGKDYQGNLFEQDELSYNTNFYFDSEGITFVYNQYEIAAYVYGIIPIKVPYGDINAQLKNDFKTQMGITATN